jgi:deazaflavin-dependent oxidoreductase (nitroreductase family)
MGDHVIDSPRDWVASHTRDYVESGGRKGHLWKGAPTLLLTTRGRKTGQLRRTALIYGRDGERYVVVASRGGNPNHPNWYLNLLETPAVTVQVMDDLFDGRAQPADEQEYARLWSIMTEIWPAYDDYQSKTTRKIPIVVIDRL